MTAVVLLTAALVVAAAATGFVAWHVRDARSTGAGEMAAGDASGLGVPEIAFNPRVMPLSREEAERINELRPTDVVTIPSAAPFTVRNEWRADPRFLSALDCLTQAVYYEAASEPDAGQRAVAQVVLNRVRHPAYPASVCGVVYQGHTLPTGCQFTFTCDGSLLRPPSRGGWATARRIALAALSGWVEGQVGLSTHYHADYVVPYWASSLRKVATVGRHIFYGFGGRGGAAASFNARYDFGSELPPMIATLQALPLDNEGDAVVTVTIPESPLPRPNALVADDIANRASPHADAVGQLGTEQPRLRADQRAGELRVRGNDSRLIVD
ncbi:cell wall hydrolase [Leptolyngbya sp. 15MV]|nr:cell wall hydrolase [Leptolyngbya sp. 15MV]